jgi:stress response protein YsnF
MSRTVTALYDTKAEAEAARQRLTSAVDVKSAKVIDQQDQGSGGLGEYHLSHDDRHAYGEGLRRGGALLCAEVDGDEDSDKIVRLLEETSSVDLDQRQESWRQEGWAPYSGESGSSVADGDGTCGQSAMGGSQSASQAGSQASQTRSGTVEEERIPIVEEELRVGKREVERGGARVRTYVREVPVQEQVTLREEHVQVERRPVEAGSAGASGLAAGAGGASTGDMLQERTVEMVEKAEEAVVQKVAQVREEVVLTKTAEERTEQISDTVRRTEVDVQEGAERSTGTDSRSTGEDRSAFGGFGSGSGEGGNR